MKKIISVSFILLVTGVYFLNRKPSRYSIPDEQINVFSAPKVLKTPSGDNMQALPRTESPNRERRVVTEKPLYQLKEPEEIDTLAKFPRVKITGFKGFQIVEGIVATLNKIPSDQPIKVINGIHYYASKPKEGSKEIKEGGKVIYDTTRKQYGLFTGEVVVTGNYKEVINYLKETHHEILYNKEIIGKIVFKVEDVNALNDLSTLNKMAGVKVELDLQFAKIYPQ
jgi:hypothetical protein